MRYYKETVKYGSVSVFLNCPKHLSLEPVKAVLQVSIKDVRSFFIDTTSLKKGIRITLLSSRVEFDSAFGEKTEDWMSGGVHRGRVIIFHPDMLAHASSHPKKEFPQILTHEICHIVTNRMNAKFSWWLSEGIAQNVARQNVAGRVSSLDLEHFIQNSLFVNHDYGAFIQHDGYKISYMLTKRLISQYGRKIVLNLLDVRVNKKSKENFSAILQKKPEEFVEFVRKIAE